MNNFLKRALVLTSAIAITSSALVACGGGDDDATPTATATSTATIKAATGVAVETATPTQAAAATTATSAATPEATTNQPSGLAGTWNGTYEGTSEFPSAGTFVIDWTQSGSTLSGIINVTNSECVSTGEITGTISGTQITFGAVQGPYVINYEGSVADDTMSGTYASPPCGNATGTWTANKQ